MKHMRHEKLQVKNPKDCFQSTYILNDHCSDENEDSYFTFVEGALECQEQKMLQTLSGYAP